MSSHRDRRVYDDRKNQTLFTTNENNTNNNKENFVGKSFKEEETNTTKNTTNDEKDKGLSDYVPKVIGGGSSTTATISLNNAQGQRENMTQTITTNVRSSRDRGSWEGVLGEYLKHKGDTPWREKSSRVERATAVRANPTSPQAWLEFLEGEVFDEMIESLTLQAQEERLSNLN